MIQPLATPTYTSLSQLKPGARCTVVRVHGSGSVFRRLLEMGLIENTEVKIVRYAPLGDPVEIELLGYHLSLRKAEARLVEVRNV